MHITQSNRKSAFYNIRIVPKRKRKIKYIIVETAVILSHYQLFSKNHNWPQLPQYYMLDNVHAIFTGRLSECIYKIGLSQLLLFLNQNNIFIKFQSGFRALHSTESALLKMLNGLLLTTDSGECSILVLLDLGAAFDTVDHDILIGGLFTPITHHNRFR